MRLSRENISIMILVIRSWAVASFQVHFLKPGQYLPDSGHGNSSETLISEREWRTVHKILKGIERISPFIHKKRKCLVEALIAIRCLKKMRVATHLHLGSKKTAESILAHAWVSVNGKTIIGGPAEGYQELIRTRKNQK